MRKLNISVPVKYTDRNGDTKTKWVNIGGLVINDDGKVFGNIDAIPTDKNRDGSISCFDREERQNDNNQQQGGYNQPQQQQQYQAPQQPNNVPTTYVDANGNPIPQQ